MRLDRNITVRGLGKYGLVNARKIEDFRQSHRAGRAVRSDIRNALDLLEDAGIIEWGGVEAKNEFFVMKLKDEFSQAALYAYAAAADAHDPEYAGEVREMAARSGPASPWCKKPD